MDLWLGFASPIGAALGDVVAVSVSFPGLGAVLAASPLAFAVMKRSGAASLVWLGVRLWRSPVVPLSVGDGPAGEPTGRMMRTAFTVTTLNPKRIISFAAFMPQFVDAAVPAVSQVIARSLTFVGIAVGLVGGYALPGGRAGRLFRSPRAMRLVNRADDGALVGAGAMTATLGRA